MTCKTCTHSTDKPNPQLARFGLAACALAKPPNVQQKRQALLSPPGPSS